MKGITERILYATEMDEAKYKPNYLLIRSSLIIDSNVLKTE